MPMGGIVVHVRPHAPRTTHRSSTIDRPALRGMLQASSPTSQDVPVRILTAEQVREALPMRAAIDAMREAFGMLAKGRAEVPLRTQVKVPGQDAVAVVMPGRCDVPLGLGAKIVSVFPRNPAAGRPLIHAAVVLLDGETGEVAALVEGTALTAIRTGAASGLATDLLARPDATRVAIIGSGAQARTQLLAVCCVRKVEAVSVYSRAPAHAARFAEEMAGADGVPERIATSKSARDAAHGADIVCTATSAMSPVLALDDVAPGTHINAIGSFTPEMRELDPALVAQARVVVDQRQAAMAEAGEVIAAVRGGLISETDLVELGEIVNGAAPGRTSKEEITLFKSVGLAVQDMCAGARAVAEARLRRLGVELAL